MQIVSGIRGLNDITVVRLQRLANPMRTGVTEFKTRSIKELLLEIHNVLLDIRTSWVLIDEGVLVRVCLDRQWIGLLGKSARECCCIRQTGSDAIGKDVQGAQVKHVGERQRVVDAVA